jgi:hypothetical protein
MKQRIAYLILFMFALTAIGCSVSRQPYSPHQKYPATKLKQDYTLFRNILEESHPSLYWFTSRDSMNYYFDQGYSRIRDSMNEPEFRNILSFVINKIHCGHTSVRYSRKYAHYLDTARLNVFPLAFKVWPDSMAIVTNLNQRDSALRRGTIVTGVENLTARQLTDTLSNYLSGDGRSRNGQYQGLSNRGSFGSLYRNVFGLKDHFTIRYLDAYGVERETSVPVFVPPPPDTSRHKPENRVKPTKEQIRAMAALTAPRFVQIDTTLSSAYMTVNTFARGNRLRSFFRKTFRELHKRKIQHLVIDVRSNGGGDAGISTKLTRYLVDKKFKLADSLYAIRRTSHYGKHISWQPWYWLLMQFVTHKEKDGFYHFGYFERHYFKPIKRYHFNGSIYIITGGNSFSATTLFAKMLKGQSNVLIIGEETGGGAYGNTAWMIPDAVLPNTKIRFRLPKFRLVMDSTLVKDGRGIIPDIEVGATTESIRRGIDPKVELVRQMIIRKNALAHQ